MVDEVVFVTLKGCLGERSCIKWCDGNQKTRLECCLFGLVHLLLSFYGERWLIYKPQFPREGGCSVITHNFYPLVIFIFIISLIFLINVSQYIHIVCVVS